VRIAVLSDLIKKKATEIKIKGLQKKILKKKSKITFLNQNLRQKK